MLVLAQYSQTSIKTRIQEMIILPAYQDQHGNKNIVMIILLSA